MGLKPPDLGEAIYRPLIEAEEAWVEKNIVKKKGSWTSQKTSLLPPRPIL